MTIGKVQRQEWESNFFGKEIYYADVTCTENDLKKIEAQLFVSKVSANNYDDIDGLGNMQFKLAEGECTYVKTLSLSDELHYKNAPCEIDEVNTSSIEKVTQLEKMVRGLYDNSRYREPWYSRKQKDDFYVEWIKNAINKSFDDICFANMVNSTVSGFVTLKKHKSVGRIGLIGVAPEFRGRGIARVLLSKAEEYCLSENLSQIRVATQLSNLEAIKLYNRTGYTQDEINLWFYR
jgi:dTDP-4-amino-4,6-dideoxy-D-galactose acyltransferase